MEHWKRHHNLATHHCQNSFCVCVCVLFFIRRLTELTALHYYSSVVHITALLFHIPLGLCFKGCCCCRRRHRTIPAPEIVKQGNKTFKQAWLYHYVELAIVQEGLYYIHTCWLLRQALFLSTFYGSKGKCPQGR